MKKLVIILVCLVSAQLTAQEEFSFEMYFEDALGNRDTLVLGYDAMATDSIDAAFGEVDIISQPWSDFEVRTLAYFPVSENSFMSKKQIVPYVIECDSVNPAYSNGISIYFKGENYPILISTSLMDMNQNCRIGSVFDVGGINTIPLDVMTDHQFNGTPFECYNYILNDSMCFLGSVQFRDILSLSLNIKEDEIEPFSIYPNPAQNIFTLQFSVKMEFKNVQIKVYNLLGEEVITQHIHNSITNVNVQQLPLGLYLTVVYQDDKAIYFDKLIKN